MTRNATKEERRGGQRIVATKRRSKAGSWAARAGRVGKRAAITQVDENATLTCVHVARSSGLVTYLPTYERLKAFHSRLYFRPVNRVPLPLSRTYETAAAPLRAKQKDSFSLLLLYLFLFLSKKLQISVTYTTSCFVCASTRNSVFSWISHRTRADVMIVAGKQLRYLGSISFQHRLALIVVSFNHSSHSHSFLITVFFSREKGSELSNFV